MRATAGHDPATCDHCRRTLVWVELVFDAIVFGGFDREERARVWAIEDLFA